MIDSSTPERRVLVTGANGFIGRALIADLARAGWRVRAARRRHSPDGSMTGLHAMRSSDRAAAGTGSIDFATLPDLAHPRIDRDQLASLLDGVDCVVHLAGLAHQSRAIADAVYMQINGHAVESLAEAARRAGVRRVILMSSVRAQSGPIADDVLTEDRPASPTDAYGRSKLRGEIAIAGVLGTGACDYVVLRPVLVYGARVGGNMAALARLARMPVPLPLGALRGHRSLIGLDTICHACRHAIDAPAVARQTLLIADPGPALTVRQMLLALRAGAGRRPGLVPVPARMLRLSAQLAGQAATIDRLNGPLVVDTERMRATGWHPQTGTSAGLYVWAEAMARELRTADQRRR